MTILHAIFYQMIDEIQTLLQSQQYIQYQNTYTKFHRYSQNNIKRILKKYPQATFVAGYHQWKYRFHRAVKKGEKGIPIWIPIFQNNECVAFKNGVVFDIKQTVGKQLPTSLIKKLNDHHVSSQTLLLAVKSIIPIPIQMTTLPTNINGFYSSIDDCIYINESSSSFQKLNTCLHEFSHFLLHQNSNLPQNIKEIQAEVIAYLVLKYFQHDCSAFSYGFIVNQISNNTTLLFKQEEICISTAEKIIKDIEHSHFFLKGIKNIK